MPWDITNFSSESDASIPVSAGAATRLIMRLSAAPGGSSKSATLTVYKNGNPTSLTCTISNTETLCSDASNSVTFDDGDSLAIRYSESGSPASARISYTFRYALQ